MALKIENLLLTSQHQKKIYEYVSADTLEDMDTAGYFNDAVKELDKGTVIFAHGSNGFGILAVNANDGTTVDTANVIKPSGDTD